MEFKQSRTKVFKSSGADNNIFSIPLSVLFYESQNIGGAPECCPKPPLTMVLSVTIQLNLVIVNWFLSSNVFTNDRILLFREYCY